MTFLERIGRAWQVLTEQRSIENPATPLSAPADWLFDTFGGLPTLAGERISERTALQITTIWACVQIISQAVATLPLCVYKRLPRGREKAITRREYYLLHDEPNDRMSSCVFRETVTASTLLWGKGCARIDSGADGKTRALWPLQADLVKPFLTPARQLRYAVKDIMTGEETIYLPEDILYIPGLSFDGITGLSPIRQHREGIGLSKALESFGAEYFGNGTILSGTLNIKGKLSPDGKERLSNAWKAFFTGRGNRHKVPILEEDATFNPYTNLQNNNAQFNESRKFQIAEIARIYHVPLHMLAETENGPTYASAEQFTLEFVQYTLRPHLVRWELELNRKLFPSGEYYCEHNLDGLLRGDFKTRMDGYAVGRQWGWLSVNDIRDLENLNPLPGADGDQYLAPMNMTTPERIANPPKPAPAPAAPAKPEPPPGRSAELFRNTFADAIRRSLNYESKDPVKLQKFVSRAFAPILCDMAESTGGDLDAAVHYADILHSRVAEWQSEMSRRSGQAAPLQTILNTELEAAYAFIQGVPHEA